MREYEYFLFENFDAEEEANHPLNPRRFLGQGTDPILSAVVQTPVGKCSYAACCDQYGPELAQKLVDGGILCRNGDILTADCPVFLREDAAVLHTEIRSKTSALVDTLQGCKNEIREWCAKIDNGFSVELNLYHVLCGMVFDGAFFDYLSDFGALATSRQHPSGLDYLTVIYEKCEELQALSDGLLCSYNRFVNEKCALQSFGDARGNRFDFYRFFRLMEQGSVPDQFKSAEICIKACSERLNKDRILDEVVSLAQTGNCAPTIMELLELFGYAENGVFCVPVYLPEHRTIIRKVERIVESHMGEAMCELLAELAEKIQITAVRHNVNRLEIANELYHIVFGFINEELVARGLVAAPNDVPGEGRYLKCIELY